MMKFMQMVMLLSPWVGAQSVDIDAQDMKQVIDMMGGDMERSSKAVQNAGNTEQIIQWGFGDINFNTCRVQFDKNQELVEGTKNWGFYTKQVATMQAIKALNPDIKFFGTARTDYDGFGDENNMPDWIVDYNTKVIDTTKYAVFLADYLEYMHDQGVTITYLSIIKEWTSYVKAHYADDIIRILMRECDARGVPRPLISDQGFWSLSQGIWYMRDVVDLGTQDLYHSFSTHNYQNEGEAKWIQSITAANALGKPMYDDEMSTGAGGPSYGVEPDVSKTVGVYSERAVAYKAGLAGEIIFEIWSRGIDRETRAIYYPAGGVGRRMRGYFIMKQFANNILGSRYTTSILDALPQVSAMVFRLEDKMVLWVMNEGNEVYYDVPVQIENETVISSVVTKYWTNATPIEGDSAVLDSEFSKFHITIDSNSIASYIFYLAPPCGESQNFTPVDTFDAQSGYFSYRFEIKTTGAMNNGIIGLSGDAGADNFDDLAVIVQFNTDGFIKARNGSIYEADTAIAWSAEQTYELQMLVDYLGQTYSVLWVKGLDTVMLARDYAFRSDWVSTPTLDRAVVKTSSCPLLQNNPVMSVLEDITDINWTNANEVAKATRVEYFNVIGNRLYGEGRFASQGLLIERRVDEEGRVLHNAVRKNIP